jgi:hypothetical protein
MQALAAYIMSICCSLCVISCGICLYGICLLPLPLLKMVELLVAAGAAVEATPGPGSNRTALVEAVKKGNVAMMETLLGGFKLFVSISCRLIL